MDMAFVDKLVKNNNSAKFPLVCLDSSYGNLDAKKCKQKIPK